MPSGRMLEMQLRSASVRARVRLPGQIGAHAVGRGQPRPLADQNRDAGGAERGRDGIADRDAAVADDHQRRDPPAFGAQRRQRARRGPAAHAR